MLLPDDPPGVRAARDESAYFPIVVTPIKHHATS